MGEPDDETQGETDDDPGGDPGGDPIAQAWQRCCQIHPDIAVAHDAFAAYLAARRPPGLSIETQLTHCLSDLYLACACVAGDRDAIRAFDRDIMPSVDRLLARWNPVVVDDTRQRLLAMFLVDHAGRGPLLASYTGRGALRRWVRVIAAREAGRTWRTEVAHAAPRTEIDDDQLLDVLAPRGDPEMAAIQGEAAAALQTAFMQALGALERRERAALRLHLLDGLTIDDIAPMYRVHRATVARWIAAARQGVLDRTRRRLMHDLRLTAGEVDSLIRLVGSRIELALSDEISPVESPVRPGS